jgi:flagellar hook-length control protein FliK
LICRFKKGVDMLNLKLEVDLKLSQAEKARFTSEKEQADKNAFYSELERAEKAWSANEKPKLKADANKEPEQTIGGNLHKKSSSSADEKTDSAVKTEKHDLSNKQAEQHIGGNLQKKSSLSVDDKVDSKANTEKLNSNNKQAEQHIGGNLHKGSPTDQETDKTSASEELNTSSKKAEEKQRIGGNLEKSEDKNNLKEIFFTNNEVVDEDKSALLSVSEKSEQHIGGNLYTPRESDANQSDNKTTLENIDISARNKDQHIGGNLNKDKVYQSELTQVASDSNKQAEQPVVKSVSDTLLAQIYASNSQTTEVKQHLAPVSKALKDVLSQYLTSDEQITTKSDQKIDTIVPPNLDKDALEEIISPPNKFALEVGKGEKPIDKVWPIIPEEKSVNKLPIDKLAGSAEVQDLHTMTDMAKVKQGLLNALNAESKTQSVAHSTGKIDTQSFEPKVSDASVKSELGNVLKGVINSEDLKQATHSESSLANTKVSDALQANNMDKTIADVKSPTDLNKAPVSTSPEVKLAAALERMSKAEEDVVNNPQKMNLESSASATKLEVTSEKFTQQINKLAPQDKLALQQSLQQAIDSGKLNDIQLKRAQDVLATLAQSNELQNNEQPSHLVEKSEPKPVNLMTGSAAANKPDAQVSSYNNTKVTAESLSEVAKVSAEQSKVDNVSRVDSAEVMQIMKEQSDNGASRKVALSPQAENIFKAITAQPQALSPQSLHEIDISQTVQQFETVMQNVQTQQNSVVSQKLNADPNLAQALNLQKADVVKALHEKVNAMLTINNKEAEIRLDPPELGSMQIRIRSEAEQAQINFVVQNQQAKEALEQSMPKLKEMLAEQGIQLGESNIQQDSGSSSGQDTDDTKESSHSKLANQESQAQNSQQTRSNSVSSESGIDYYA